VNYYPDPVWRLALPLDTYQLAMSGWDSTLRWAQLAICANGDPDADGNCATMVVKSGIVVDRMEGGVFTSRDMSDLVHRYYQSKKGWTLICSHFGTTIEPLKPSKEITMSTADTYVRARIDTNTKERAADALEAMGLSISDAIRLLMLRIADERRMPFDVKAPNATTRKAIAELEAGKGKRFASVDDLMADLHADD